MVTELRSFHPFFCFKGGRLAVTFPVSSSFNNFEKRNNFMGNTFSYSPLYIAMYKAWEAMAKDNVITEVT